MECIFYISPEYYGHRPGGLRGGTKRKCRRGPAVSAKSAALVPAAYLALIHHLSPQAVVAISLIIISPLRRQLFNPLSMSKASFPEARVNVNVPRARPAI